MTPSGKHAQSNVPNSAVPSQWEPGGHVPSQVGAGDPPVHGTAAIVVLVVDCDVVLVVVATHGGWSHASQQLVTAPVHAGAAHAIALGLIRQRRSPLARVVQQVTAPGRPQVDLLAHRLTLRTHSARSIPPSSRLRATPTAHRT